MKKLHLLSTAAAALLLTAGVASAQVVKKDEAPGRAPAAQQNAPAEKIAPPAHTAPALKTGERKTPETTGQAAPKEPAAEQNGMKPEPNKKGAEPHATINGGAKGSVEMKGKENNNAAEMKGKENKNAAEMKGKETGKSATEEKRTTTGQGAAAGAAKLSTEQRTKITTIFHSHHVAPAHLNISIHVGARIPETVHFYPVPVEVVDVYPEWRGFDYILVGDQILIVDPGSHEIVAVLPA